MIPNPTPRAAEARHTPGPWFAQRASSMGGMDLGAVNVRPDNDERELVCTCGNNRRLRAQQEANARIIAAAPELLKALQKLSAECQLSRKYIVIDNDNGFAAYNATAEALLTASSALSKALAP